MLVIAEIGDKVARPLDALMGMLLIGFLLSPLTMLAGALWRKHGVVVPVIVALVTATIGVAFIPGTVKYLLWDVVDSSLRNAYINELGITYLWQTRIASWAGAVVGFSVPLGIAYWIVGRLGSPVSGACLRCGYSMRDLESSCCPECGEPVPVPSS